MIIEEAPVADPAITDVGVQPDAGMDSVEEGDSPAVEESESVASSSVVDGDAGVRSYAVERDRLATDRVLGGGFVPVATVWSRC